MKLGIIAPSSVVPQIELANGLTRLAGSGFDIELHPQCAQQHFTFAGTDAARCDALWQFANDPSIDVLWCARGGYGAQRLLPMLDMLTEKHGVPARKLLVGYSDITVLHEYVRTRWNWATLHAAMPAASNYREIVPEEYESTVAFVRGEPASPPWTHATLRWLTGAPVSDFAAPLVGGNLCLWTCLAGTRYVPDARGKVLFFEDLGEAYYRLDRMMVQMEQAGMLNGVRAIVLGDFLNCNDDPGDVLANADGTARKPLRPTYDEATAFEHIFATVGRRLGIPIATGLPVGHGPHFAPLPLGATYNLGRDGSITLTSWDWFDRER
jgi:muramoyltetrapeptide carboxypeptidase